MKKHYHIFLLIFLAFFAKVFAGPSKIIAFAPNAKESSLGLTKADKDAFTVKTLSSKVSRQKFPKKPKGIQVIVPNLTRHVFHTFYRFSNFSVHEVKGDYSLLLHYSHGMRGPPGLFA